MLSQEPCKQPHSSSDQQVQAFMNEIRVRVGALEEWRDKSDERLDAIETTGLIQNERIESLKELVKNATDTRNSLPRYITVTVILVLSLYIFVRSISI